MRLRQKSSLLPQSHFSCFSIILRKRATIDWSTLTLSNKDCLTNTVKLQRQKHQTTYGTHTTARWSCFAEKLLLGRIVHRQSQSASGPSSNCMLENESFQTGTWTLTRRYWGLVAGQDRNIESIKPQLPEKQPDLVVPRPSIQKYLKTDLESIGLICWLRSQFE